MSKTAEEIIDDLGGLTAVAAALDTPVTTVSSWKRANRIPRWWQSELIKLALSKPGIELSTADFPPQADRRKRAA